MILHRLLGTVVRGSHADHASVPGSSTTESAAPGPQWFPGGRQIISGAAVSLRAFDESTKQSFAETHEPDVIDNSGLDPVELLKSFRAIAAPGGHHVLSNHVAIHERNLDGTLGIVIGGMSCVGVSYDDNTVELGIWLRKSARGLGYADEALRLAAAHFQRSGCRVVSETTVDNGPMNRVFERIHGREIDSTQRTLPDGQVVETRAYLLSHPRVTGQRLLRRDARAS